MVQLPQIAHNAPLGGDTLYTLSFNYQWRKFVVAALSEYLIPLEISDDDEARIDNIIADFYDEETAVTLLGARHGRDTDFAHDGSGQVAIPLVSAANTPHGFDTGGFWFSSFPTLFVPSHASGLCHIVGRATFDNDGANGRRAVGILEGGANMIAYNRVPNNSNLITVECSVIAQVDDISSIELIVDSSTAVTLLATDYAPMMEIILIDT